MRKRIVQPATIQAPSTPNHHETFDSAICVEAVAKNTVIARGVRIPRRKPVRRSRTTKVEMIPITVYISII